MSGDSADDTVKCLLSSFWSPAISLESGVAVKDSLFV